jgi:hypothetical protein
MANPDRARANGLKAFQTVREVLTEVGWEPQPTDTEGMLTVDFSVDDIPVSEAIAEVRIEMERFVYYLNFRDRAAPANRAEAMEFVTRANFGLVIGNFELNLANGAVRLKASVDFTGVVLSRKLVTNVIQSLMDVAETYGDAYAAVSRGKKKAAAAIEEAEQ